MDKKIKKTTEDYLSEIEKGIEKIESSEEYTRFLKFLSMNHNYSLSNQILAMIQYPKASFFKGYKQWKKLGRQVEKGSKAIKILAPFTKTYKNKELDAKGKPKLDSNGKQIYNKTKYTYFGMVSVFDISQTSGKELPSITKEIESESEISQKILKNIQKISKELKIAISTEPYKGMSKGYYEPGTHSIRINDNGENKADQLVKTLFHELGHSIAHRHQEARKYSKARKELEAESIAYVICQRYKIDTSDYSFGYIAGWNQDKENREKLFKDLADDITSATNTIMKAVDKVMEEELIINKEIKLKESYLNKSRFINDKTSEEQIEIQLNKIKEVTKENQTFVEIVFCEQWGDESIFESGDILSPNQANLIIKKATEETEKLKELAEKQGEYYPYSKCKLCVYHQNNEEYETLTTKVCIGDDLQSDLIEHLQERSKETTINEKITKEFIKSINQQKESKSIVKQETRKKIMEKSI